MKRKLFNTICILCVVAAAAVCFNSCKGSSNEKGEDTMNTEQLPEEPIVKIETSLGTIKVKLYKKTPLHKNNFIKLVKEGYYDGLRFHRVIDGFMIQGGDPYSRDTTKMQLWGQGGPDYTIPAEFVNEYYHKKGALAAARKGDMANPKKASSGSQFYIVQDEMGCIHLDGQYSIFGETIEGLEVIDKIAQVETDPYDRPLEDVFILKATIETSEQEAERENE
jgi:cyclophilin family peptidyl-prolyl cis-trans isomerase